MKQREERQDLQDKLKQILAGEHPFDILVRWKPLAEQAIGWNPDLNDGVRLNIRPFLTAGVLRWVPKSILNPIERLWDWMRDEVTRGHCHISLPELRARCQQFIAEINGDPQSVIDRLWPKFELDLEYEAKLLIRSSRGENREYPY